MANHSQLPSDKPKETTFHDEVIVRMDKIMKDSELVTDRLQRIITRAFGEVGQGSLQQAAPKAVPSGSTGEINERLVSIQEELSKQSALINRIDNLV